MPLVLSALVEPTRQLILSAGKGALSLSRPILDHILLILNWRSLVMRQPRKCAAPPTPANAVLALPYFLLTALVATGHLTLAGLSVADYASRPPRQPPSIL